VANPKNVLDTSALLAWIQGEPGGGFVEQCLAEDCAISAVNLCELATKLLDYNYSKAELIGQQLRSLGVEIVAFEESQALAAAQLRKPSRQYGLSLGDRACLALAQQRSARVLTADVVWQELGLPIDIINIRFQ
jgi:PIN domain nuclease of toxin-antitoxin system